VLDAAAFGLPDDDLGEVVAAALVVDAGIDRDRVIDSTIAHCQRLIGSQLTPRRVFLVEELPRSDAGKLYRQRLTDRFASID